MKTSFFALGLLFIWGVGCGDDGTGGEGGTSSTASTGASGSTKTGTGATGSTTSSGASGTGASTTATTTATASATSASTGAGMADIDIALISGDFFSNCQLPAGPDPLGGSFVATFQNAGPDAGTVTVTHAEVIFTEDDDELTWTFETTPVTFDLPNGANEQITFEKGANTGMGSNPNLGPCSFCGMGARLTLNVTFDDGTELVDQTLDLGGSLCAF